jgi:DNA replication protein DnaC
MSELLCTRIRESASRLHLSNLEEQLESLAERADATSMGYLEFLDLVLEEETGIREGRRFRNALKLSGLPHHKTLDEFDFAFQPDLDRRKVKDLASLAFVQSGANGRFWGPRGWARPCSPSLWPSPPVRLGSPSTSPALTTW